MLRTQGRVRLLSLSTIRRLVWVATIAWLLFLGIAGLALVTRGLAWITRSRRTLRALFCCC
ncbi:hypothetical protein BDF14DRAFT_1834745 [Spinellus fusiger]|nr:hypothetical protein BDF14DRAFT_1834745 [Spinellus fusiger]